MLRSLTSYVRLLPGYRMYRACKVMPPFPTAAVTFMSDCMNACQALGLILRAITGESCS